MNEMRKLMEAVIKESDAASLNPREFAAFEYGVDWGNSAQYGDGGYERKDLPSAYQDWVDQGRPQPDSYEWDESLEEDFFQSDFVKLQKDGFRAGWEAAQNGEYSDWEEAFNTLKGKQRGKRL